MNLNTVSRNKYSKEITKSEAKRAHLRTIGDIYDYVLLHDENPEEGKSIRFEGKAGSYTDEEYGIKEQTSVRTFSTPAGTCLYVSFTVLEYYESDEDGDFVAGSDFDQFAEFTEDEKNVITDFLELIR